MKTCGECPAFKLANPDQYIQGDGWCNVKLPTSMRSVMWGEVNEAIRKDHPACSFGPLLKNKAE